jgi:hypothetical protein
MELMDIVINNPDYTLLFILMFIFLCLVSYSANRQLHQPILAYGGLFLSSLLPIILPIYLGFMFFKAKNSRLYIFLFLLSVCLTFLNLSASGFSKNIKFSDLYRGKVALDEGDNISIEGEFLKRHETQYLVPKDFNIGGSKFPSNDFYYEIVPTNSDPSQKMRVFVADVAIFNGKPLSKNLVNRRQFNAYVYFLKNVDKGVLEKIRTTLKPEQELIFIAEHSQSTFQSNQKTAIITTGIFGLLSLIFSILAFRAFRISRNQNSSIQ